MGKEMTGVDAAELIRGKRVVFVDFGDEADADYMVIEFEGGVRVYADAPSFYEFAPVREP